VENGKTTRYFTATAWYHNNCQRSQSRNLDLILLKRRLLQKWTAPCQWWKVEVYSDSEPDAVAANGSLLLASARKRCCLTIFDGSNSFWKSFFAKKTDRGRLDSSTWIDDLRCRWKSLWFLIQLWTSWESCFCAMHLIFMLKCLDYQTDLTTIFLDQFLSLGCQTKPRLRYLGTAMRQNPYLMSWFNRLFMG